MKMQENVDNMIHTAMGARAMDGRRRKGRDWRRGMLVAFIDCKMRKIDHYSGVSLQA